MITQSSNIQILSSQVLSAGIYITARKESWVPHSQPISRLHSTICAPADKLYCKNIIFKSILNYLHKQGQRCQQQPLVEYMSIIFPLMLIKSPVRGSDYPQLNHYAKRQNNQQLSVDYPNSIYTHYGKCDKPQVYRYVPIRWPPTTVPF